MGRKSENVQAPPGKWYYTLPPYLRELEGDNLLKRTVYPIVPPKVEYSLTDFGLYLRPILIDMYIREQNI